jgi:hypothetical protein
VLVLVNEDSRVVEKVFGNKDAALAFHARTARSRVGGAAPNANEFNFQVRILNRPPATNVGFVFEDDSGIPYGFGWTPFEGDMSGGRRTRRRLTRKRA